MAGYHTGDDYSTHGNTGVPVKAARGGWVVSVTGTWGASYGIHLIVEGRHRRIRVGYCHLSSVAVQLGDWVDRGQGGRLQRKHRAHHRTAPSLRRAPTALL